MTTAPLITCMCLTRNRREWLPKAIECFQLQTYANRELLIVMDGEDVSDLLPRDERIRLVATTEGLKVGAKRNIASEYAAGDIIAHWDDDDYSMPERLSAQFESLSASGKAVTGYYAMKFTDGAHWWQYMGAPSFALGTSLCYLRSWWRTHPFADMQVGQDEMFATIAARDKQLAAEGDLELMYATIHPVNTSPRVINDSSHCWTELPGYQWRAAA